MRRKTVDNLMSVSFGIATAMLVAFGFYLKGVDFTERGDELAAAYTSSLITGFIVAVLVRSFLALDLAYWMEGK